MGTWTADVRAVLFDMDGTLIDSTGAVARSWATWAERWGVADRFGGYDHGLPARRIVSGLVPADRADEAFRDIEAIEVGDVAGIRPLPGAVDLLASIPADAWAIVTSCSAPLAAARIAETGLHPRALVTASDVADGKPAPDPYLAAAAALGVDPADCLVVEDAPAGVRSGRAAGCRVLAVLGTVAAELLSEADAVVPSLAQVTATTQAGRIRVTATTTTTQA